ncbi:uncharacterized protein LOC119689293 [Teleopsis dalmanni]|uniref:uncharacterized protein LOC119689293 n=1 Tax=Teleopsis dalmanni TaxID=139649 RepID=UPI0018CF4608|nr:uncharacterized protein LOC119689293 [Teleopsis dalmanni]
MATIAPTTTTEGSSISRVESNGLYSATLVFKSNEYTVGLELAALLLKYPCVSYSVFDFSRDVFNFANESSLRFDTFPPITTAELLQEVLDELNNKAIEIATMLQEVVKREQS